EQVVQHGVVVVGSPPLVVGFLLSPTVVAGHPHIVDRYAELVGQQGHAGGEGFQPMHQGFDRGGFVALSEFAVDLAGHNVAPPKNDNAADVDAGQVVAGHL